MDIMLIKGKSSKFVFPALPEKVCGKQTAKYQSFDIISQGTVKVPQGTDVTEISWEGEFFGSKFQDSAIVKKNHWKEPVECVNILTKYMQDGTVLNLIVTDTWINLDVTISSFQSVAYGAFGNIKYSIEFVQKKPLEIYTTNELKIAKYKKKTKPRSKSSGSSGKKYKVVKGDTLQKIAAKKLGSSSKWKAIYDANKKTIEAAAKKHGKKNSDRGRYLWPGTVLTIPK